MNAGPDHASKGLDMRVLLPTPDRDEGNVLVDVRPVWSASGEVPIYERLYTEGAWRLYGSGTVEVVVTILPITLRMPWTCHQQRFRSGVPVHARREAAMALRKITQQPGSASTSGPGAEDALSWPNIWEHLTQTAYPDGTPRQTSSIIIVADASGWRGCLSDKDNNRTLWRTAATVEGLLLAIEEAAASDDPGAWRQAGGGFKNRRKRS